MGSRGGSQRRRYDAGRGRDDDVAATGRDQARARCLRPRRARPRVFAYSAPLPPYTRVLEWRTGFVHKLFRRSPYCTTNGDCADLYFIPNMDVPGTAYRRSTASVVAMFEHVARAWPWWNRTGGGARHFVYSPCDHGPCDCMFNGHLYAGRDVRGGFDVPVAIAPKDANRTIGYIMLSGARVHSHFQSGRDIRLPTPEGHTCGPFCGMPQSVRENRTAATLLLRQLSPWTTTRSAVEREGMLNAFRPTRVFFGGRQGGGGRAVLFRSHAGRAGFGLHDSSGKFGRHPHAAEPNWMPQQMATSDFCFSPNGANEGDSDRYLPAMLYGCIPVFVTGDVPPFADVVSWEHVALSVELRHVPRLHELIGNLSHAQVVSMRRAMASVWPRMLWTSALQHGLFGRPRQLRSYLGETGADDAFATLVQLLAKRTGHL